MTKCDSCRSPNLLWRSFVSGDTAGMRADGADGGGGVGEGGEREEEDEGDSQIAAVWLDLKAAK